VKSVFEGQLFTADLTVLESIGIDMILGMDWLAKHNAMVSCNPKCIQLEHPSGTKVWIEPQSPEIAMMLCNMSGKEIEEIPVVCDFPDVFPEELTRLPSDQDVELVIELMPGAGPVAKSPYRMSSKELDELKKQLKKLLKQGFTCTLRGEERWHQENVHRLPHTQLNDDQEQVPTTQDREPAG
jgi:hypothetical protein